MSYIYLGADSGNAFYHMASDEVMVEETGRTGNSYLRFLEFERPAVILARSERYDSVRAENCADVDITRRRSSGSAIICNDGIVAYSITVPSSLYKGPKSAHRDLAGKVAVALSDIGIPDISVGEHFSIRAGGKTLAGHGQTSRNGARLYHGVLALEPWDVNKIDKLIRLRSGEYEFIGGLPSVRDYDGDITREDIYDSILLSVTEEKYKSGELPKDAVKSREIFYRDDEWVIEGLGRLKDEHLGFCFVDWSDPEKEFY